MSPPLVLSFPLGRDLQRSQHTSFLNNTWDPNTSLVLKIKLLGNYKKSRQDVKCFSFDMVVDSDTTNYMDLVESVVEKYPPGYLDVAHIHKSMSSLSPVSLFLNPSIGVGRRVMKWPRAKSHDPRQAR